MYETIVQFSFYRLPLYRSNYSDSDFEVLKNLDIKLVIHSKYLLLRTPEKKQINTTEVMLTMVSPLTKIVGITYDIASTMIPRKKPNTGSEKHLESFNKTVLFIWLI